MLSRLTEDELHVYYKVEKQLREHFNTYFVNEVSDMVYDILVDENWEQEFNVPPGSQSIDAAADRIIHNLRNKFYTNAD